MQPSSPLRAADGAPRLGEVPKSGVADYALRRRALLRQVTAGWRSKDDVCDATPWLLSAAKFHGEQADRRCPICRRERLRLVHYIYGEELRSSAGQARNRRELALLAEQFRRFDVYVVEVCRGCGWNHLIQRYGLGQDLRESQSAADPTPFPASRAPRPAETDDRKR